MFEPTIIIAAAALIGLAITATALLVGWRGWLALKEREFILAARSIGTTNWMMIARHILPNVLSPIMVSATLGIANAIITESALSFLGLGFPPDFPTWGRLLFDATDYLQQYPERVFWPGTVALPRGQQCRDHQGHRRAGGRRRAGQARRRGRENGCGGRARPVRSQEPAVEQPHARGAEHDRAGAGTRRAAVRLNGAARRSPSCAASISHSVC